MTQTLLDSQYEFSGEPDGYPNTRQPVRLHYVRKCMERIIQSRLDRVVQHFSLGAGSRVVIIGAGYGWGVEYLGQICTCVGTESDPFYFTAGLEDDCAEICACIEAVGLSAEEGRGADLLARWHTHGPRMTVELLQEDSLTSESRQRVLTAVGGTPDLVIVEDVISGMALQEAAEVYAAAAAYDATVCLTGALDSQYQSVIGSSLVFNTGGVREWG